jgi:16S rRNA (cytosine967-C5)-methyltransferase
LVTETSARRVALAALKTWRKKGEFADTIISHLLSSAALESADRAFAVELLYGVLRNLTLLDFWIGELRSARLEVDLRDLLRLGLYQLFVAKTQEHAAVNETVAVAAKQKRAIVNGILRSAARQRQQLGEKVNSQPLDVRFSHPKFLIDHWTDQFGEKATKDLCEWNNLPPPIYARINQLKIDRKKFLERYPEARPVPDVSNFVELPSPAEALNQGDCYVQDPSTALACELLQPRPGERILDACAAPGGKTSYMAELMENRGLILACDRDLDRLHTLEENLQRLRVAIAKIAHHDWAKDQVPSAIRSAAPFDRILIDAPCSNSGVMRRRVDVRWRLRPSDFARMPARQIEIVRRVLPLLKESGTLVYSTCSLEREENEEVVRHLAETMSSLRLEEERRSFPFRENFDGAFAARFRRNP